MRRCGACSATHLRTIASLKGLALPRLPSPSAKCSHSAINTSSLSALRLSEAKPFSSHVTKWPYLCTVDGLTLVDRDATRNGSSSCTSDEENGAEDTERAGAMRGAFWRGP